MLAEECLRTVRYATAPTEAADQSRGHYRDCEFRRFCNDIEFDEVDETGELEVVDEIEV